MTFCVVEKCEGKPLDIYMVVDISKSISHKELDQERSAVREILQQFDIGKTRVGIIKYHKDAITEFKLGSISSQNELKNAAIVQRPVKIAGTRTDLGLIEMKNNMKDESDSDRTQVAIVVTDGKATGEASLLENAVKDVHTNTSIRVR